jgi:hypothetical protein
VNSLVADDYEQGAATFDWDRARKLIRILIGSKFYFDLTVAERYSLIRFILFKFPFSL